MSESAEAPAVTEPVTQSAMTFPVVVHVPMGRLNDEAILRMTENMNLDETERMGCAAALELVDRFGVYFDEELVEAAARKIPDYVLDGFLERSRKARDAKE